MRSCGNSYKIRKYKLNENYFDEINSPEKAYWLGLISADGHISKESVSICLKESDGYLLSMFLESLGSDSKLWYDKKTKSYKACVYSKHMVNVFNNYGFYHNKSKTQTFPNIDKDLYSHFIRGLLDGDGSIMLSERVKKRYKKLCKEYSVSFCGTLSMISTLKSIMIEECNANDIKIQIGENDFSQIRWCGRVQVLNILDWIYKDSTICLDRKHERYISIER